MTNLCALKDIAATGAKPAMTVSWSLEGARTKDPQAKLSILLEQIDPATQKFRQIGVLRKDVAPGAGKAEVDVAAFRGKSFRNALRKIGDPETGGVSSEFDIE